MDDSNRALLSKDIDRFSRLGHEELQKGDVTKAVEAFIVAFRKAKQLDDDYLERSCAFNLGAVYIASKKPEKGLEFLQRAVPPMNKRDGGSNGDLYYNFGLGYESLKNSTEMIDYFQMALKEYELEDNQEMIAALSKKLAQHYVKGSMHKDAADCFGKAAKAYGSLLQVDERIQMLNQRTQQLLKVGDKRECLPTLDECFLLCQKMDNKSKQVKFYGDLGLSYTQCGDYIKACKCFREALHLVKLVSTDKRKEAVIVQNLGAVYNSLGQYDEALKHHTTAAAMHAELGNRGAQGQCFSNAAYSYTQLGDNESAGEFYLHALQAAKDAGDKHGEWQAMEGLGAVAFNKGLTDRAVLYFNKALVILSGCEQNPAAQERIVGKLTDAIQFKVAKTSDGLPPLPVSRSTSKKSLQSAPIYSSKKELLRSNSGRPPSIASLPPRSSFQFAPAPPEEDIDRNIRLLVNDESLSDRDFYRPSVPLTRRPRKISDTGMVIPEHNVLGLSDYDSETDISLATVSSRHVSRDRRLSDELDGMLKQFREDRKDRKSRPLTARPERRKKRASLTNQEVTMMRARRRSLENARRGPSNIRTEQKYPQPPKKEKTKPRRRVGARRPISPSDHHGVHNQRYERPLLRTNTFNSKEDYRHRMAHLLKINSDSDIDWEYLNRIGPKVITPRDPYHRSKSYNGEDVQIFSRGKISETSSTTITGSAESTEQSETESDSSSDSDEETIEEHQENLPTSFNRDSIRYARTSEEYRRMMKEDRETQRDSPATPSRGMRPDSSRQRPSDRRPFSGRPGSARTKPVDVDKEPQTKPSPREPSSQPPSRSIISPRTKTSPIEEVPLREELVPVPLPVNEVEMAAKPQESPRPPSLERPPSRERFEKRMMEHMEAEKSEPQINHIDKIDSAQSSSVADTDSRSNSREPDYEDALPAAVPGESPMPVESPPSPSPTPVMNRGVSQVTDKSDNRDLEEYRRKLERRDASLDGSELTESGSSGSESESGSSYTSSDSRTLTADEEPLYESIKTARTGSPPPVPPPLVSTYEKPKVTEPGPNFFKPDTDGTEEKITSSGVGMDESGLYESIRTGKFDVTAEPTVTETPGEKGDNGEGASETSILPNPPNIQDMSRAEKEKALYEYQSKRDEYQKRREERRKLQQQTQGEPGGNKDNKRLSRSRMCIVM